MKIIICGAGKVGTGIARQLVAEDNSVTVIDYRAEHLAPVLTSLDVSTYAGYPSHPTVLEQAGAGEAEMIIAVTASDETNMITCQVAHSLFNVPIKIARIRHPNYLQPIWKDLYRHDHLPIDHIISPEQEVADAIINRLRVPGAMDYIPFADGRLSVIEIRCSQGYCPIDMPLKEMYKQMHGINARVIAIRRRDGQFVIPRESDRIQARDEIFFVCEHEHVSSLMRIFSGEGRQTRRVLIIGGGNIGFAIAKHMEHSQEHINVKLIEINKGRAEIIASRLPQTTVLNGSSLDRDLLIEAGIANTETVIAVTNDDEVNILSSLLAKQHGGQRAFCLVNKGVSYNALIGQLGIDVTIDPRETTVSSILQHTHKGKVRAAHTICDGVGEIIEAEVLKNGVVARKEISEIGLPDGAMIGAVARGEEVFIPEGDFILQERDRALIISRTENIQKIDKIFSTRNDYF